MTKPRFDPTFSWGHLVILACAITFLVDQRNDSQQLAVQLQDVADTGQETRRMAIEHHEWQIRHDARIEEERRILNLQRQRGGGG